ncbi:MAG: hypothetical protein JO273_24330 [Methylobacteriaceae bacterium]|nr:hypothetical protein [Methylobacteriaceae bacterium]
MNRMLRPLAILAILGGIVPLAAPQAAYALNARSWVSATGNDPNPCTRTQPCLTFAGAFVKTAAGGVINCLDSGNFQGVDISKSITIDCTGVEAGTQVTNPGGLAFQVDAGPNDVVVLRGLDIQGTGQGSFGIRFFTGGALHVENCVIRNFNFTPGWGIDFAPETPAELYVSDTVFSSNGSTANGGGILAELSADGAIAKVMVNRVQAKGNFFGIKADGSAASGVINMTVRNSVSSGNSANGIVGTSNRAAVVIMIDRSTSSHNIAGFGVIADGPATVARVGNSSIAGNINGVGATNGASLQSYDTNQINGNSNDGIASVTPISLH